MTADRAAATPRPGFLSGLLPSMSRAFRNSLPGRRLLVLGVVLAIPPLLALAAASQSGKHQGEALATIVFYLYLQFLIPICGLLFAAGVLLQEMSAGNLPYLCTRPVPRTSVVLGRYMALVGVGLWLSALNVQYRDIRYVIPFLIQLWLFCSPVIYPASMATGNYKWIIFLNPMSGVIKGYRACIMGHQPIDWSLLGLSATIILLILISGLFYFRRMEKVFADVV